MKELKMLNKQTAQTKYSTYHNWIANGDELVRIIATTSINPVIAGELVSVLTRLLKSASRELDVALELHDCNFEILVRGAPKNPIGIIRLELGTSVESSKHIEVGFEIVNDHIGEYKWFKKHLNPGKNYAQ